MCGQLQRCLGVVMLCTRTGRSRDGFVLWTRWARAAVGTLEERFIATHTAASGQAGSAAVAWASA